MRIFLVCIISVFIYNGVFACDLIPSTESCDFYLCLEENKNCGEDGYPIGYGNKYCNKFTNACSSDLSSESASKWILGTKMCLQKELNNQYVLSASCDGLYDFAFDTHPFCYTSGAVENGGVSFCLLSLDEWFTIATCVENKDLLSDKSLKQVKEVASICLDFFVFGRSGVSDENLVYLDLETELTINAMSKEDKEKKALELEKFKAKLQQLIEN